MDSNKNLGEIARQNYLANQPEMLRQAMENEQQEKKKRDEKTKKIIEKLKNCIVRKVKQHCTHTAGMLFDGDDGIFDNFNVPQYIRDVLGSKISFAILSERNEQFDNSLKVPHALFLRLSCNYDPMPELSELEGSDEILCELYKFCLDSGLYPMIVLVGSNQDRPYQLVKLYISWIDPRK